MQDRTYLRLQELRQNYNISEFEILYAIENKSLKLSFYINNSSLLVGHYKTDKFIAHGRGSFSGVVSVDRKTSLKLFENKKVKCTNVIPRTNGFTS